MKKKKIIVIVCILVVLLIIGLILFVFKPFKKGHTSNYLEIKDTFKTNKDLKIIKALDVSYDNVSFVNDKYITYIEDDKYSVMDFDMNKVITNQSDINYDPTNDVFIVKDNNVNKTLYLSDFKEEDIFLKIKKGVEFYEGLSINGNVYYIVKDTKGEKIYYPKYLDGYLVTKYDSLIVIDNYLLIDDHLFASDGKELGTVNNHTVINNKYVLLEGDSIYLYDLIEHKMDTFNKVEKKNGYYILGDKYLSTDGEWLDKNYKDKRRISDTYHIDYSSCKEGFKLYKNNKKYSNDCYKSILKYGKNTYIGSKQDSNNIVIFENDKLFTTENSFVPFGTIAAEKKGEDKVYYNKNGKIKNACKGSIAVSGEAFVCTFNNTSYFMDANFKKTSDTYNAIECYQNSICRVKMNNQYGIAINGKVVSSINYPNLQYIDDNIFLVERSIRNQLIVIGEGTGLEEVKYEEFKIDLDIEKVINDYKLEELRPLIKGNEDLFKKYAFVIINNEKVGNFKRPMLQYFNVIVKNKKILKEKKFFSSLGSLEIEVVDKITSVYASGLYDFAGNTITLTKNEEGAIYHELIHFLDANMSYDGYYDYNRVCRIGSKYYDDTTVDSSKCTYEELRGETFLIEAGAETNAMRYAKKGSMAYQDSVYLYNMFAYLLGENVMNDIFFNASSNAAFFLELNKYGITLNEYNDFMTKINSYTSVYEKTDINDFISATDFVSNLYKKKNGKDWANDKKFSKLMHLLVQSHGSGAYMWFEKIWNDEEIKAVKEEVDFQALVNSVEGYKNTSMFSSSTEYTLMDGKDCFTFSYWKNNKIEYLRMVYDFKQDKFVDVIEYDFVVD